MGAELFRQHLIDPQACIRCDACEQRCPIGAITHREGRYAVDPARCNACGLCLPVCPTGATRSWRVVPKSAVYPVAQQLGWSSLPRAMSIFELDAL